MQCDAVWCRDLVCGVVWSSAMSYGAVWCSLVHCGVVKCSNANAFPLEGAVRLAILSRGCPLKLLKHI